MKTTIKLDAKTTSAILVGAVRTQSQIVLESAGWGEVTINGFLISGDDSALLMEVTGKPPLSMSTLVGVQCGAQLYCEQRYVFATKITATPQWGESRSLALARPAEMSVLDRRRFARAKLAPSSRVTLDWHHEGLARHYAAALLNISPDGLSCRLEGSVREAVRVGGVLGCRFDLPNESREFVLEAVVLNLTPTAGDKAILGLQFIRSPKYGEALLALRDAVRRKSPMPETIGAPA